MTKTNQSAEKVERFLLDNQDKCRLEVEYDFDGNRIFIQLTDKDSGTCTVFDGSDIFRQVHEFVSRQKEKHYRLKLNGQDYTGTAADVARWYCKQKGIKLYILPNNLEHDALTLFALFDKHDALLDIAQFETDDDSDDDIETGYQLFFTEYLLEELKHGNPDFTIVEL